MAREEKRWITPDPVVLPEFVGEVQEETTASAVEGDDLTLDGGGGKGSPATEPATAPATEPATEPATAPATEPAYKPSPVLEPVTEPAYKPSPVFTPIPVLEPVTKPAYKPSPVFTPSPVLEPDTAPGVGVLKKPKPAIDPVWQPWGATQPQTVPSLISKAKPLENKVKFVEESTAPKKISDFFGELSAAATGGKVGVEGSVETLKRIGIGTDTAHKIVKGTQYLGAAELAALTAPLAVAKGGEAIKRGAQTIDDLIKGVKAGRTAFGGAY